MTHQFIMSLDQITACSTGRAGRTRAPGRDIRPPSLLKTCWRTTATTASFPEAVPENEEVVPVNVSTWVLPSGVTVGR